MAMGANHKTMLIFILIILILAIVILVGLPSSEPGILMFDQLLRPERDHMYSGGLNPTSLPAYLTDATFPKPPHGSAERIIMFAGKDLRRTDLSRLSQYLLSTLTFDMNTRWPASTTVSGFSPSVWLERGKYPGLRIKTLHAQGVMGQGVGVAVFDKPILRGHHEFKGRLVYRRLTPKLRRRLHFHGISCASILAGQTCGVAPKADLYYIAVPDVGQNFFYYTLAMGELMKINRKLPQGRKVRIVSISDGIAPDNKDRPAWEAAISEARKQGIAVLYSNTLKGFTWGGVRRIGTETIRKIMITRPIYKIGEKGRGSSSQRASLFPRTIELRPAIKARLSICIGGREAFLGQFPMSPALQPWLGRFFRTSH